MANRLVVEDEGLDGDWTLEAIRDWEDFKNVLSAERRFRFPSDFLYHDIEVKTWKNIPIPLVESTKLFMTSFRNVCSILKEYIKENEKKSTLIVKKFRLIEGAMESHYKKAEH